METVAPVFATEEEIHCSEVAVTGATSEEHMGLGPIPSGTFSFAPSLSLNIFANIFQVSEMDWMGDKLRNLAISPLPLVESTPSTAAILEEVPHIPLDSAEIEVGSLTQPPPAVIGYFLSSGEKNTHWGLGKDSLLVSRGRG